MSHFQTARSVNILATPLASALAEVKVEPRPAEPESEEREYSRLYAELPRIKNRLDDAKERRARAAEKVAELKIQCEPLTKLVQKHTSSPNRELRIEAELASGRLVSLQDRLREAKRFLEGMVRLESQCQAEWDAFPHARYKELDAIFDEIGAAHSKQPEKFVTMRGRQRAGI
jgi:hypothetical protein